MSADSGPGAKKALKALARPVKEIADAISRQDAKWLTSLPGIGAASAEQIITTLKRKVTKFALGTGGVGPVTPEGVSGELVETVYQALTVLGMTPLEARQQIDKLLATGKPFKDVEEAVKMIFGKGE